MAQQLIRDLLRGAEVFEAGKDLAKQYRMMAVVIHPDKCHLDGAASAFHMLKKTFDEKNKKAKVYQEVSVEELLRRQEDAREVSQAMKNLRQARAQLAAERDAARKNLLEGTREKNQKKKEKIKEKQRKEQESKAAWQAAKEEKARVAKGNQKRARIEGNRRNHPGCAAHSDASGSMDDINRLDHAKKGDEATQAVAQTEAVNASLDPAMQETSDNSWWSCVNAIFRGYCQCSR
ncbi:unnamed protein product [Symbiodinium necroappetens]|uniref:J domain-containing protein n=1 Tax=Symbiodinium necroappetens TaxID=1628268 RepID=A0A813CGZ7_9DINO|nr:unnamed protein product [Symbiodinium necroappetens]